MPRRSALREGGRKLQNIGEATSWRADIEIPDFKKLRSAARSEVCGQFMSFWYVYILQSISDPTRHYTGFTQNLKARLDKHNQGEVAHTSKYTPWKIQSAIAFTEEVKAREFEKYLKSGSGRAFAKKHF
jgi:putative endonuclease